MFNGLVFVLLFTGFCSSTDVNTKDYNNIFSLAAPTTLYSSVLESADLRSQSNTPELTKSKCNNNQLVEKILKIILTLMKKNVERQVQTSNVINVLIKIVEKNVGSFNKRETKFIYDILNNIEASEAIQGRVDSDLIKPSQLKISSNDNKSLYPRALLKIQAFLHLIDELISDELLRNSKKYMETESNPEDSNEDSANYKTIYNLFNVKPINCYDLDTNNEHIPIDVEDEVHVPYKPTTNPTEINVQPYSNIVPYTYLNENAEDKIPIVFANNEYYEFNHKLTTNPTEINVQPYSNIVPYTYLNKNVEDKIPIDFANDEYYDFDHKPTTNPTEINVQPYSNIEPYTYLNENVEDKKLSVIANDEYYDFNNKPMTNPTEINVKSYSNIEPFTYLNENVEDNKPLVIANDEYYDFDHKPMANPTEINVQPYSYIDTYGYINEKEEDNKPMVIANNRYYDFDHKSMTNPTEINVPPYSNIVSYTYLNKNVEDKIPIVIANDEYYDLDHKPTTNPTEINVQPYSNIVPYTYLNENVEDKIPIVFANNEYYEFNHKLTTNPTEINVPPYSNIVPYTYLNKNVEGNISIVIANDKYYDFGHKPMTNPLEINVQPYSNIVPYTYLNENVEDKEPIVIANDDYHNLDHKPTTNPKEINVQPYSNIVPFTYLNENVEDKKPIVIANDEYYDLDHKPTTNPTELYVQLYSNIVPNTHLNENIEDKIPIDFANDEYYDLDHKPMTNPTEINVSPYSNIEPYTYLNENTEDKIPVVFENDKYFDFNRKPTTNPTEINVQPYSNIDPYTLNENAEDKIPIDFANDEYYDLDHKPMTNPSEINVQPYSNIEPYTYLNKNVENKKPIVIENDEYYHFDHKPKTNPTEINVQPYSNIDPYGYINENEDKNIPMDNANDEYSDFNHKSMTNPTEINVPPYSNIEPYTYLNENTEDKIPFVFENHKHFDFNRKPMTNLSEINVQPYPNIALYTYLNEKVKDNNMPIVTENDKYYDFDHKPTTDPTEINKEEIENTNVEIRKPKQLMITVPKKKHVVEHVTPKIMLVPNYPLNNYNNLYVENVKTTTKRTVNIDDVGYVHYMYNKRYPKYDQKYIDKELSSEKPINTLNYSVIPNEMNPNSAGILQINVVSTTKSPMPYYDYEDTMPYHNPNLAWNNNYKPWNEININDDGNSQPEHDFKIDNTHGPWNDGQNPWNDKYYLYNNNNNDKDSQGHTSLVNITSNSYKNDKPLHSWQEKTSNYYVEENLVPMDGHKVVPNGDLDWYDIEGEFTTQHPVSTEVTSLNHYSNEENPFYNSYLNIELTTKATPITIDGKYSYSIYNVLPDGDNYGTKTNTNDGSWKNYQKYYKSQNIHLSYPETFDKTPIGILNQVTEENIPLNEFTNLDNPNQTDDLNIPINYDIIQNVTPSNYAENLETTPKVIHIIKKDHIMYHIPPSYQVNKQGNVIKNIKNRVNQVNHPNPYNWNPESQWNQHVKLTAKGPIPVHKMLKPNSYNKWYSNHYSTSKHVYDYSPNNNPHLNHEMLSKMEHFPKGTHIYENDESYDNAWNRYLLNQNTNGYHSIRPSIYDFSTWKDVIEITTRSPKLFTAQIPHNSESHYKPLENYESTTPNPEYVSYDDITENTDNDDLPLNSENPWQLEIEVTTKYSMILHDVPDYDDPNSIRDGDRLDSSAQSKENGNGVPINELETSTSSLFTENNNKPINENFIESNNTITSIVATHETNEKTKDGNESEEQTQTVVYDSLNIVDNPDHYYKSSEENVTGLSSTEVNNLKNNGLEPEPEVIQLIEETIKNIEKNVSTDTDSKLLESIEQLKRMIKEPNLSIKVYIQILQTFHYIQGHFKLYTNVDQVIPLSYVHHSLYNNNTQTNENNVVEITYLVQSPKLIVIYPYYYVKYNVPVTKIDQFLSQNLNTSEKNEALDTMFLRLCTIADLSPALKKLSKENVDQLVAKQGHLIKTDISNSEMNLIRETHNIIKFNDTATMNDNEELIKEIRIKVNKKPYHTITAVASDFKGTPIIEDKNSPNIDNLNDLNNPFRKIFPMHKLIRATEIASAQRINDHGPWIPPFIRVDNNKPEEHSINRDFNRNGQYTEHTSGQSLSYISTAYDNPKAFVVNSSGRNTDEIIPPIRRFDSDPNGKYRNDKQLNIPSMRLDNDPNDNKRVYRRDVGKMLDISPILRDPNARDGEMLNIPPAIEQKRS